MNINKETYFAMLKANFDNGMDLMMKKNADYAGKEDPFRNFRAIETMGLSVKQGILVRMSDKFSRIGTLLSDQSSEAQVKDESIEDTLLDLINYANILLTFRQVKKQDKMYNSSLMYRSQSLIPTRKSIDDVLKQLRDGTES